MFHLSKYSSDVLRFFLAAVTFIVASQLSSGQAVGDYRTNATGSWNWNDAASWQRCVTAGTWTGATNTTYPGQVAGAGEVTIQNNTTVTITADVPFSIGALTIDEGNRTSYVEFDSGVSLTVSGETNIGASTANNRHKGVLVEDGWFRTGSVSAAGSTDNRRDAYLSISAGSVVVDSDITMSGSNLRTFILFTGSGTLQVGGTISGGGITSTAGGSATAPTSGTVIYAGTTVQAVGEYTYYNLTLNNSTGFTLAGDVTINNLFSMVDADIASGANIISLANSAAGSLVYSSGTITGLFQRAVGVTSADYLFPVGTSDFYRPAIMNFSTISSTTLITAEFIASPPFGFLPYTDGAVSLYNLFTDGYWRFSSTGTPTVNYSLTLTADEFTSFLLNPDTRITGRDNTNTTWRALGSHGSQSGDDISRTGITNLNTTSFDFALASDCSVVSLGYNYEREITIDHTLVSGGTDLFSFPMLVRITGEDFLKSSPAGSIMNPNGYDIVFTDEERNKLDHQLEYYNGTTGDLIAWVRLPRLSASSNTIIRIMYGNSEISVDQSVTTVWDSHYKGVWHLNSSSLTDATYYDKSATAYNSPTYPTGVISNSLGLNGTNQYVQVIDAANTNFAGDITVSAWVYMAAGGRDQKIAGNQNNSSGGYKFGIYTNDKVEFEIRNSANQASLNRGVAGGTTLSTGQWYYLAGMSSDVLDSIKTLVNGIPERPFKKTGTLGTASNNVTIGREPFTSSYFFSGNFDELRISDKVRSNGWLRTEYNNQYSPSSFYALGAEMSMTNLPSVSICQVPVTLPAGRPAGGTYSGNPYISGNIFTPPAPGTYTIVYTYSSSCGPVSIAKEIIVTPVPAAPDASDQVYCTGQIANLVATTGENLKWYSGGVLVSTANPFTTGLTVPGTYTYKVTQSINGCESDSTEVTLTILTGIIVSSQPVASSICEGGNASFTIDALGFNMSYQWQENGVNITDGGIYSGATTATLTLTNPGSDKDGLSYRCVLTSTCGTSPVNSDGAILTITPVPVAAFSYAGSPYCPDASNPLPTFIGGGMAGTFSSTAGLVFVSTATGEINIVASTPGIYTVTNTIAAAGGCGVVESSASVEIIAYRIWTGTADSDWNNPANWTCGLLPDNTTPVQIPNVPSKPVLSTGAAGSANDLTIDAGSSLVINGNILQIAGTITNGGDFTASSGTIEMNGTAAQSIGSNIFTANTIGNLTINNNSGVTLLGALNVSGIVTLQNGDLISGGNLTLLSDASGTALISGSGTGSVSGNVTMQRYLPAGFGYKYFSSPFTSATVGEFSDESIVLLYRYDENRLVGGIPASGWVNYNNTANTLNPLAGYAVNFGSASTPKTVDMTGTVNSGPLSLTVYNNDQIYTKGLNLIGNPYPSPIDWDLIKGGNVNVDDAIYYFKASTTDQYGGTYSSYVNGISSDGLATNVIPSMQGFFIHVSDGAYTVTGTINMDNSVRITDQTHSFMKSGERKSVSILRLAAAYIDDLTTADPLVIYYDEKAGKAYDSRLDGLKLFNTDVSVPNFYAIGSEGKRLSINGLPLPDESNDTIPLGLRTNKDAGVSFMLQQKDGQFAGRDVYIYDGATGVSNPLETGVEYRLFLTGGDYTGRFSVIISDMATKIPVIPVPGFFAYYSGGMLVAEVSFMEAEAGTLTVHNLQGQLLFTRKVFEPGRHEFTGISGNGIYVVSFVTGKTRLSQKLFIYSR
ncbi:MAG: DUF2341 domain-containing protein [Bacteroidales bacterium]|nr:DUF2341 domain-containing protein [Bacteroidales bacterium]